MHYPAVELAESRVERVNLDPVARQEGVPHLEAVLKRRGTHCGVYDSRKAGRVIFQRTCVLMVFNKKRKSPAFLATLVEYLT
jgi:hypothetical protein